MDELQAGGLSEVTLLPVDLAQQLVGRQGLGVMPAIDGQQFAGFVPAFQVQILVGLLIEITRRKGNPIGDGTRLEAG